MNYIKNVGDNQNKFGDTATVFQLGLMKDDEVYNFGDNQVTVNIANETGYVLSVTPDKSSQNTVLNLDFNKVPLKNLTPDSYRLEVEVQSTDGDIAKFPTSGAMTFSINHDLKETSGELVPTVTFDNVLAAVDEKIAVYMDTVKVGPQGPAGPAGNVDTSNDNTFTGTNTFNKKIIAPAGVQGNADTATKLQTRPATFTDFADVAANMTVYAGNWSVQNVAIKNDPLGPSGGVFWYEVTVTPAYGTVTGHIEINSVFGSKYYSGVNAGVLTGWYTVANDSKVAHNTGTETIAGDKTFTGNNNFSGSTTLKTGNYGLRVTTSGIQKTSDNGVTWTNI